LGSRVGMAKCLANVGSAYSDLGAFRDALPYHRQALELYTQLDESNECAGTTFNIGMAYHALGVGGYPNLALDTATDEGLTNKALDHYDRALSAFAAIGNQRGKVLGNYKIGTANLSLGHEQQALDHLRVALDLCREMEWGGLETTCLSALARANLLAVHLNEAFACSAQAMERLGDNSPPDANELHFTHYRVLMAAGREEEARPHLERAREAVMDLADSIRDRKLRRQFLDACGAILRVWEKQNRPAR